MMNRIFLFLMISLLIGSCHKDQTVAPAVNSTCGCTIPEGGTPGWPHGHWHVKYEVTGTTIPDSVYFRVNMPDPVLPYYLKKNILTTLPLTDSTDYCGDLNSDITMFVWDQDTTHVYTCKIFVNNVLKTTVTGVSAFPPNSLFAVAQCQ